MGAQSVILPFISQETLPIVGDNTLYLIWSYLFTHYYNSYDYSHSGDDFDHGNSAVFVISKGKAMCNCAEGWEFGNSTWFTKGDVVTDPMLSSYNPGACCNFLVDPRCGEEPFGFALWCPINLTTCTFRSGEPDPGHTKIQAYLHPVPEAPATSSLIANGLSSWSFCVSSFADFFSMDGKPRPFVNPSSRCAIFSGLLDSDVSCGST